MENYSPIIVICIDGFDPEYFESIDTPNMDRLISGGFYTVGKSMWPVSYTHLTLPTSDLV